jgi:hypothetical protein
MASFLPLFPLKIVVFPNERVNLHIFEPRYKELINECQEEGKTFGIPAYLNGKVQDVGTEIEITKIAKLHPNGEMDIKTKGLGLFKIQKFHRSVEGKLYSGADIEHLETDFEGNDMMYESIHDLMSQLFKILNIKKDLPDLDKGFNTYEIAHHIGLSVDQEYELLCIPTEYERQEYVKAHLTRLIPIVAEMERLRERVQMNGHFKNIIPPKI